jgi:hypothetical protein
MEYINAIFDCGFMVVEESYYKNYILHLIAELNGESFSLGVYF